MRQQAQLLLGPLPASYTETSGVFQAGRRSAMRAGPRSEGAQEQTSEMAGLQVGLRWCQVHRLVLIAHRLTDIDRLTIRRQRYSPFVWHSGRLCGSGWSRWDKPGVGCRIGPLLHLLISPRHRVSSLHRSWQRDTHQAGPLSQAGVWCMHAARSRCSVWHRGHGRQALV